MERYAIFIHQETILLRTTLYKLNYRFNTVSIKIAGEFFGRSWQVDYKLIRKCNKPGIAKTI